MVTMETPLREALDKKSAAELAKLDLATVGDLVRHYPRRYLEPGELTDLSDLTVGEEVTVLAKIENVHRRKMRYRDGTILDIMVTDGKNKLKLTFFNQKGRERTLSVGRVGLFAGTVKADEFNHAKHEVNHAKQLVTPSCTILDETTAATGGDLHELAAALLPIYPATAKLESWKIDKCVRLVLDVLQPPPDPLPAEIRRRHRLLDLATALRAIHQPRDWRAQQAARKRLAWDEAFTIQAILEAAKRPAVARPARPDGLLVAFDARLPFQLTAGQREVGRTLEGELAGCHPMYRLLQGEVGSGKTVCALRAMLQVIDAGGQAALLAPTEVLAAQHARSLRDLLGPLGRAGELDGAERATRVALLTGSLPAGARRTALGEAATGSAGIVVGTHALLSEGVTFADLGLIVVDEQHRFGVEQRDALRAKAGTAPPHLLVMTATPIPRTVAMTVYGDLEVSALRELPQGRAAISTFVVATAERSAWLERAWRRLREEVAKGHQAYVVCPRIGDAEAAGEDVADQPDGAGPDGRGPGRPPLAVLDVAPMLAAGPLSGLRLAVLHGRLPAEEKDSVMRSFSAGSVDVLVATTVVEVGVDVPNATAMVVLDADRFGVSQLHQMRGRVGRGSAAGLCLLVTDAAADAPSQQRLRAVAATTDGFELAQLDLEQRREGDVLGSAQSGVSSLRLLTLRRGGDADIIAAAREEATGLVRADPRLDAHPALAAAIEEQVAPERAEYLEKA